MTKTKTQTKKSKIHLPKAKEEQQAKKVLLQDEDRLSSVMDFDIVSIKIASPEKILSWSKGEIKKPETINYRTFKPEKDGLFCEKIFGPTKDWECSCGKYKKVKFKGVVCDRCGVEVTRSSVRRERMGHIELAAPCSHIWFFKAIPSKMGLLLDMNLRDLERVIYYEEYIVIDPGETSLRRQELLTEEKYQAAMSKFGNKFTAKMGAEAILELLKSFDLKKEIDKINREIKNAKGDQTQKKYVKRLKVLEAFKNSSNNPSWMILEVIPVIPPDLRPLVPLEGGRFATSDLNDLYRRVINRNNRLKKLIELKAPEVIIRNEKWMLQEAVDALFDNGRHGRPVMGPGNRPLKSLSDMLKGKQGRFRQNLLGKRVDYSGRSVIVVGPELKLNQCGLPKQMALELFEPFIVRKLRERGFVHTIKSAKKMVEKGRLEVWDILDEVIKDHPILLNRAPTLHRLGIQGFEPILVEGKAIRIHPLVCVPFNADFDGDQMAVHVPLSIEAQIESKTIILSTNNIFSPASGKPVVAPTQDIIFGCRYLTEAKENVKGQGMTFSSSDEVITAYQDDQIDLNAKIKLKIRDKLIETTTGRVLFNTSLPEDLGFVNEILDKSKISEIIANVYRTYGHSKTVETLDKIKNLGFDYSTVSGMSMSIDDLIVPKEKEKLIDEAKKEVARIEQQYQQGLITEGERYNKVIDIWTHTTDKVSDSIFKTLDRFNSVFLMADSGARGSKQQIRQLCGMRGLMAKPSGEIIERPITANFKEGLTVLEYFISTHGARKGLADTALKTADSGYLTRRLIDVAQDVIITEEDCGTMNGILVSALVEGDEVVVPLRDRLVGRVTLDNIVDVITDKVIVAANEVISMPMAQEIEKAGIEKIRIRSVLTCESQNGVCQKCYGINLATQRMVDMGEAVGIVAAQSIGEPGTQLTMRTFHIGGTAFRVVEQSHIKVKNTGTVTYHNLKTIKKEKGAIVLNRNGQISINEASGRELERHTIPIGARIKKEEGEKIEKDEILVRWDPYTVPILSEISGIVNFEDFKKNESVKMETDPATGITEIVVLEHKSDFPPELILKNESGEVLAIYPLPAGAHIVVKNQQKVEAGDVLAKCPRVTVKTKDITGGLPRVAELFEARRPKNPAIIAEIDGMVEFGETKKGQRRIIIKSSSGMKKEYIIPHGKHINVYKGDWVIAGQQLVDGPIVLQDILRVGGDKNLQEYLLNEIQAVYRLQGVQINDKHIEVIIKQMLRKLRVDDPGDTKFLIGQQVDKVDFKRENDRVMKNSGKPAQATQLVLGVTKASLSTDSFISAASFQETTRVLSDAAASAKIDGLKGLKENVIIGHLIPAGTGFSTHRNTELEVQGESEETTEEKEETKET